MESAEGGGWLIAGAPLDPAASYLVAINDFLLTGNEIGLDFLKQDNPELTVQAELIDIRNALIDQLQVTYGTANP